MIALTEMVEDSPVLDSLGLGPITVSSARVHRAFENQRDRLAFVTTSDARRWSRRSPASRTRRS